MTSRSFPILFIGPSHIGDAVLCSGLLRKLAQDVPGARFTLAVGARVAPLFAQLPGLERTIILGDGGGLAQSVPLWREVRKQHWNLVVDVRGSGVSAFLRRDRRAVWKKPAPGVEPVHKVLDAARLLTLDDQPPEPWLFTSPEIEARAEALMAGDAPILAMGPAANWVGKVWPIERFAITANRLLGPDGPLPEGRLAIFGGPNDIRAVESLNRAVPRDRVIDLTGQIDVLTSYACLKHVRLFIGNDSGLMHLAAAAGAPTIGLFGPSDERVYAPWGEATRVVRGPRTLDQIKQVDAGLNQTIGHMMDLPVDTVVEAARELLTQTDWEELETLDD